MKTSLPTVVTTSRYGNVATIEVYSDGSARALFDGSTEWQKLPPIPGTKADLEQRRSA